MSELYKFILSQAGIDWPDGMTFDCTKIDVSRDVQDMAYDAFMRNSGAQEFECNMYWALSGPKVDKDLPPNTVLLHEGYLQQHVAERASDDAAHYDEENEENAEM